MKKMRGRLVLAATLSLAILVSNPAAAQNYGLNDQLLTIDSTSFLGFGVETLRTGDGYLNKQTPGDGILYAPLQLPDGAVITKICLSARNTDASNVNARHTAGYEYRWLWQRCQVGHRPAHAHQRQYPAQLLDRDAGQLRPQQGLSRDHRAALA